jgi:phosphatidylinositol glycan class T
MVCDENKAFNAQDTCYPKPLEGEMEWSLSRIFGRPIRGSCPLGKEDGAVSLGLRLDVPAERTIEVIADATVLQGESNDGLAGPGLSRAYQIPDGKDFDLFLPQQTLSEQSSPALAQPSLYATRQMTGYGAERGGIHSLLRNPNPYPQRAVYLESLPWFLRPYIHTLKVDGGTIEKMYYTPLLDRERGTHLELLIEIPAESTVELRYDFEKAILRYTEYPPDANRGFDIPAAIIRVLPSNQTESASEFDTQGSYLRTTSLLLPLPTPDFSMPYNVIILTSTVIALGFGSVFNLLVRRFVLVEEVPVSLLQTGVQKLKEVVAKLRSRLKGDGGSEQATDPGDASAANGRPKERSKKDK